MKIKNALLGVALFVGAMGAANAQQSTQQTGDQMSTWNWPEDKKTAQEKNALYNDEMKLGNNRKAANALHWLLVNNPNLNPAIYINGIKIYDELATAESDPKKQKVYQDSVLTLYDLRVKHFGNEAENAERKAFYAYKYFAADKERLPVVYASLKRTADLNKENMSYANAVYFMDAIRRTKAANPKSLTDEQVLDYYEVIVKSIDKALEMQPDQAETIKPYKNMVDDLLVKTVNVDCNFVEKNFGPKLKQNPNDIETAKKVFKLLTIGKCTDKPLYASTLKQIYESEKTFEMAKYMAMKAISEKNYSEANTYLNDAISLAKTNADKGDLYLLQAKLASQRGSKSEARSLAYKAIEANSATASDAYTLIGNLYMNSQECNNKVSRVEDRSIYLAAYEMYQKAGDSSGMNRAKAQFPSKGELFDENKQVGESIKVGCWIGETVTLRTRD